MGNRIARIQNDTPWLISIKEHQLVVGSTNNWRYSYTLEVVPNGKKEIPASFFLRRNHHYGMPSEIVIFLNDAEVKKSLISQHFTKYVKILICIEGPYLLVKGIPPRYYDLCWFRGCGFLGREYRGRQSVTIKRCRISTLMVIIFLYIFCFFFYIVGYLWQQYIFDPWRTTMSNCRVVSLQLEQCLDLLAFTKYVSENRFFAHFFLLDCVIRS